MISRQRPRPEELAVGDNQPESREGRALAVEREALRDRHRLFGLLRTDFFSGSPFVVEVERDRSVPQQFLDVTSVRRGPFVGRLHAGLEGLRPHHLLSFQSHHEALDFWPHRRTQLFLISDKKELRNLFFPFSSRRRRHRR
jgi:hypothetical protein